LLFRELSSEFPTPFFNVPLMCASDLSCAFLISCRAVLFEILHSLRNKMDINTNEDSAVLE